MAIIKWSPISDLDRLLADDFPTLRIAKFGEGLAIDLYEENNEVIAEMHLAGIDPEKLDISVEDNYLRIAGAKEEKKEEEKKNYYYKEIQRGAFERTVRLPARVKGAEAKAVYENGILKVTIPKSEETKKKVEIEIKK